MYKIAAYADQIASEDSDIQEKYEIIKNLSQDFTIKNDIALKLDKQVSKQLAKNAQNNIEIDVPEIELRYIKANARKFKGKINSSKAAADFLRELMGIDQILLYEQFVAIYLNRNNELIGFYRHSKGGVSGTVADVRLIILTAIKSLASGIIICHNHPSGNTLPSQADRNITSQIREAAKFIEASLLDHIILTADSFYSFADEGVLSGTSSDLSGLYPTYENERFSSVDDSKLKGFIRLAKKLKF